MIDLDLPTEQALLDQVIQRLASTARTTGLEVAGGVLEALRDALAQQPPSGAQRH
ncbi:hypothetical protein [Roseomonas indoligenes]|uniref:Uncharacterized protein n=1 Tax=Roseomonas indoligenes TaxID=2820811 RepID=A0A940S905_9PROT|nr:hypothetical protein [Pararoseomonas indoligenes]MBP0496450.1 hypothetical protein [Pararoseomonas indoligenes]